jgi:hypothetical protein
VAAAGPIGSCSLAPGAKSPHEAAKDAAVAIRSRHRNLVAADELLAMIAKVYSVAEDAGLLEIVVRGLGSWI